MKIISIIGARPQFIKTPLISEELSKFAREIIVHTGQHYDSNMSDIFLKELKIKKPKYNLAIGSANHGEQTGKMLIEIEKVLLKEKPDMVINYGDTNSTIAGALAASKLHIPVAHVEAGLRSFNRQMPEELNRVVTDHLSDLLFCPTKTAVEDLKKEGITKGVYWMGDVMADIFIKMSNVKCQMSKEILRKFNINKKEYILVTVHRQENTDNRKNLTNIVKAMQKINQPIIWPLHPRTKKYLKQYGLEKLISKSPHILLIEPIGYQEMIELEKDAKLIMTDSGGVQKEAYLARVPCITLREETEWMETIETGWNFIAGTDIKKILKIVKNIQSINWQIKKHPDLFGDGKAYQKIAIIIKSLLRK